MNFEQDGSSGCWKVPAAAHVLTSEAVESLVITIGIIQECFQEVRVLIDSGVCEVRIPSQFGKIFLWWVENPDGIRIRRVWLPGMASKRDSVRTPSGIPEPVDALITLIRRKLAGEEVLFNLSLLDWTICSDFQQRVLRAEHAIPHGCISTYGRIAAHIGSPRGGRAVGAMLAANPFPLLIPCHRAVRSTGELGGFQGGIPMKRALLEMEGVAFLSNGRVSLETIYY